MKRSITPLLLLLLSICLVSCIPAQSMDFDITLNQDEAWDFQIVTVYAAQNLLAYKAVLETNLNQIVTDAKKDEIEVNWSSSGPDSSNEITYTTSMNAKGYGRFNSLFKQDALTVDASSNERLILFRLRPGTNGMATQVGHLTYRLHVGKIISTNGIQENSSTILWENPNGTMEAVVKEVSIWTNLLMIAGALLALGVVVIVVVVFLLRSRKKRTSFCMYCGNQMPSRLAFCPFCGRQNA